MALTMWIGLGFLTTLCVPQWVSASPGWTSPVQITTASTGNDYPSVTGRASIMVESLTSGKNIMCERSMYWNDRGAGTDTTGGYSDL